MTFSEPLAAAAISETRLEALPSSSQSMAKVVVRIDGSVLGRQVADMAERGQDLVVLAEILVDRLRLGGDSTMTRLVTGSAFERTGRRRSPARIRDHGFRRRYMGKTRSAVKRAVAAAAFCL